jgi:hypothetical protein
MKEEVMIINSDDPPPAQDERPSHKSSFIEPIKEEEMEENRLEESAKKLRAIALSPNHNKEN